MIDLTSSDSGFIIGPSLVTLSDEQGYAVIENAALVWQHGRIKHACAISDLPLELQFSSAKATELDGLITPGLIDCHTHLVFADNRAVEFEKRLQGVSYETIAREGGGILSTVRAVRSATEFELLKQSLPRARALIAEGATSIEIKSGYGLDLDNERKMLRVARQLGDILGISVSTTYLAAHALPDEYKDQTDAYISAVIEWMAVLHAEQLIDAVDAFCESIAFTPDQTRRVFDAANALGLPVKLHADQLSNLHGAGLSAEYNGLSADHLEYTSEDSVKQMAAARTVAVLLPGAFHVLRETQLPPIDLFRHYDVPMAVATDCNPGTSPLTSVRHAMQLACTHFKLTPEEALRGATLHAAHALGLHDRGRLAPGQRADFAVWNVKHPAELCYWLSAGLCKDVYIAGKKFTG